MFRLEKFSTNSRWKILLFSRAKAKVQVKSCFATVRAVNEAAMTRLVEVEQSKAQELLGVMERLEVF